MSVRDLIPRNERMGGLFPAGRGERNPFLNLHREMNRLFDDAFRDFGTPAFAGDGAGWPSVELGETDKEFRITAELPGMEEKDIDVSLDQGILTIRGERSSESKDEERRFSERFYGAFERSFRLGSDIDPEQIGATFKNGLLTVTVPKSERERQETKRIPISG